MNYMPRSPKIVPGYQRQAHVETYINDNSEVRPLEMPPRPAVDTSMKTVCVFGADKGIDNKFVYIPPTQWTRFQNWFGVPNFNKYGQCALHPYLFLHDNPNTGVWAMRVLPDDAAYANGILVAHFGVQTVSSIVPTADGGTTVATEQRFQIMYTVEHYLPDGTDLGCLTDTGNYNSLEYAAREWIRVHPQAPDENGWYTLPIATIRPAGHGRYGNKFSFSFARDLTAEKNRKMKVYRLNILDNFQSTVHKAQFRGSLVNSTTGLSVSSFEDVIDDMGDDSCIKMKLYPEHVEIIYKAYLEFLDGIKVASSDEDVSLRAYAQSKNMIIDEFDPIFGVLVNTNTSMYGLDIIDEPRYLYDSDTTLDTRYADAVNIKSGAGVMLDGGNDGSFDTPPVGETFQNVYDKELVAAFIGAKDNRIIDKYQTPYDFLIDANYSYHPEDEDINVKGAMYRLNNARCRNKFDDPDTGAGSLLFLDSGQEYIDITTSMSLRNRVDPDWQFEANSELLALTRSFTEFNNRITSKEFQHGTVYDPFTKKRIVVTTTWNLAKKYIPMLQQRDIMIPFAGKINAKWDDIIDGTLYPVITNIDMDVKEELEKQRFNYYQYEGGTEVGSEEVIRMSQNTCQTIQTSLTNENNMVVLNCYVNGVEKFCRGKLWFFNDPTNQKSFTDEINSRYEGWAGTKCTSLRTYFTADYEDMTHDILRCYSEIVFRNLVKVIVHEIDVNLPVDDSSTASDIV